MESRTYTTFSEQGTDGCSECIAVFASSLIELLESCHYGGPNNQDNEAHTEYRVHKRLQNRNGIEEPQSTYLKLCQSKLRHQTEMAIKGTRKRHRV